MIALDVCAGTEGALSQVALPTRQFANCPLSPSTRVVEAE